MNNQSQDLTTAEGVAAYMGAATSEADWDTRCDAVKRANGGYPSFWYPTVIMSGLADRTAAKWNGSAAISVVRF